MAELLNSDKRSSLSQFYYTGPKKRVNVPPAVLGLNHKPY
jgi:hypothetical protein